MRTNSSSKKQKRSTGRRKLGQNHSSSRFHACAGFEKSTQRKHVAAAACGAHYSCSTLVPELCTLCLPAHLEPDIIHTYIAWDETTVLFRQPGYIDPLSCGTNNQWPVAPDAGSKHYARHWDLVVLSRRPNSLTRGSRPRGHRGERCTYTTKGGTEANQG